jgi:hypothetical protein
MRLAMKTTLQQLVHAPTWENAHTTVIDVHHQFLKRIDIQKLKLGLRVVLVSASECRTVLVSCG